MKKLLFIPLDYKYRPHEDWYKGFCKYYDCLHYSDKESAILFMPELIFVQSGALAPTELIEIKQRTGAVVMQWTGDCREDLLPDVLAYKDISDIIFLACGIAQKSMYENAMNQPVYYLQHGVSEYRFAPVKENIEDGKITFIGNNYNQFSGDIERTALLKMLSPIFKNLEIWGSGFNMEGFNNVGSIPYSETVQIYNNSFISISSSIFNDKEGYWSCRPLDIMAAGACCLIQYVPNLENYFTDMEDCVYYRTNYEAAILINYLLSEPELRNKIAKKGQQKVMERHTWEYRAFEVKQALENK